VSRAKISPRSDRRRKASQPITSASVTHSSPATGSVMKKSRPCRLVSTAVVYAPTPKNAPCPKLK
jgi:hypothetical protein